MCLLDQFRCWTLDNCACRLCRMPLLDEQIHGWKKVNSINVLQHVRYFFVYLSFCVFFNSYLFKRWPLLIWNPFWADSIPHPPSKISAIIHVIFLDIWFQVYWFPCLGIYASYVSVYFFKWIFSLEFSEYKN